MSLLERSTTRWITWGLDNLLPTALRDSETFMFPLLYLVFRSSWREFARFKERAPYLSDAELASLYTRLQHAHIQRETDLNPACIERILADLRGDSVLDVGAGRGYLLRRLAEQGSHDLFGCDLSAPSAEAIPEHCDFLVASAEHLPYPDRSIDTVVCAHTLEHLRHPRRAVAELRRVANRRLIIVVPQQRYFRITFDLHLQFFPSPAALDLFMTPTHARTVLLGGDLYCVEDRDDKEQT